MKELNKLAKKGWWMAMVNQGTLSLILTLDDFLISGPHLCKDFQAELSSDPNIFFVKDSISNTVNKDQEIEEVPLTVTKYFVLRPYIRGILYGLNPLYQISLYVPCKDPIKMNLYREIISKIDIEGQFFQDRVYWDLKSLEHDIMDSRLACLIHPGNIYSSSSWLRKISVETKPFSATLENDLTKSDQLFDLVEIRSFLEDVHQRFFSLLNDSKKLHFADMIRLQIEEKTHRLSGNEEVVKSEFHTSTNGDQNHRNVAKRCITEYYSLKTKEKKSKKEFLMFKIPKNIIMPLGSFNTNALFEEYEDILHEQLEINNEINLGGQIKTSFAKTLCRWNTITQRKSDIMKVLMNQKDKDHIHERLKQLNYIYCSKRFQSDNDLFSSVKSMKSNASTGSTSSNHMEVSDTHKRGGCEVNDIKQFTTWYKTECNI